MRDLANIEKSGFRQGEYVGYYAGGVVRIKRTNSSYGNWVAHDQASGLQVALSFRLSEMSVKLASLV